MPLLIATVKPYCFVFKFRRYRNFAPFVRPVAKGKRQTWAMGDVTTTAQAPDRRSDTLIVIMSPQMERGARLRLLLC